MASYNSWMNARLFESCAQLSDEQRKRNAGAFFGSGTACGQTYTKTIMGVAHRTLPCGTLVTFRNPANGRQDAHTPLGPVIVAFKPSAESAPGREGRATP